MRLRVLVRCVVLFVPLVIAGCGTDLAYMLNIAGGEIASLARTRPISQVLADGSVTPERADKLRLVLRVRDFAADEVGLNVGSAYSLYEDNAAGPAAYAVSGAWKDRLEPYRWTYPILGSYDAKGFFDLDMAKAEQQRLEDQGYDTFLGPVEGFSTLGILPDPVRASNLTLEDVDLVELILHELTHNTVYKQNDTDFDESIAEFIGRTAALRFFQQAYGPDSDQAMAAATRFADLGVIDDYVIDLFDRLTAFYGQPISSDEKIAGRQAIFDAQRARFMTDFAPRLKEPQRYARIPEIGLNNAAVLAGVRYEAGLDGYADVFAKVGGDFGVLLDVLREAAAQDDSRGYVAQWNATH